MNVVACDICKSTDNVKCIDIPAGKTTRIPGISYKHADLCPKHMKMAVQEMFRCAGSLTGCPTKLGKLFFKWVQKNKAN